MEPIAPLRTEPVQRRRHRLAFFLIAVVVLVLDIVTKRIVTTNMRLHEDIPVLGDWVRLTYIHNSGAAFGLFAGNRWPLIAVSVVAIGVVLWTVLSRRVRGITTVALGLILGGAIGNLIDRVRLGEVIDFVNVGIGSHRWPVFNVADSAVTVGVVWLAVVLALKDRPPAEEPVAADTPPGDAG